MLNSPEDFFYGETSRIFDAREAFFSDESFSHLYSRGVVDEWSGIDVLIRKNTRPNERANAIATFCSLIQWIQNRTSETGYTQSSTGIPSLPIQQIVARLGMLNSKDPDFIFKSLNTIHRSEGKNLLELLYEGGYFIEGDLLLGSAKDAWGSFSSARIQSARLIGHAKFFEADKTSSREEQNIWEFRIKKIRDISAMISRMEVTPPDFQDPLSGKSIFTYWALMLTNASCSHHAAMALDVLVNGAFGENRKIIPIRYSVLDETIQSLYLERNRLERMNMSLSLVEGAISYVQQIKECNRFAIQRAKDLINGNTPLDIDLGKSLPSAQKNKQTVGRILDTMDEWKFEKVLPYVEENIQIDSIEELRKLFPNAFSLSEIDIEEWMIETWNTLPLQQELVQHRISTSSFRMESKEEEAQRIEQMIREEEAQHQRELREYNANMEREQAQRLQEVRVDVTPRKDKLWNTPSEIERHLQEHLRNAGYVNKHGGFSTEA